MAVPKAHGTMIAGPKPRPKRASGVMTSAPPTGEGAVAIGGGDGTPPGIVITAPQEINLYWSTIFKLMIPALVVVFSGIAAGVYFVYDQKHHMRSTVLHFKPDERKALETKKNANKERGRMTAVIKAEINITKREISADQKTQIHKSTTRLETQQRDHYKRIIKAVKRLRARRRRAAPP